MSARRCWAWSCDRPIHARGLCAAHYGRWRRTGDIHADVPLGAPRGRSQAPQVWFCGCEPPDPTPYDECRRCQLPVLELILQRQRRAHLRPVV